MPIAHTIVTIVATFVAALASIASSHKRGDFHLLAFVTLRAFWQQKYIEALRFFVQKCGSTAFNKAKQTELQLKKRKTLPLLFQYINMQ